MMLLSAFFVILNSLQARAYSFLLPAIFKSQLTLIQTGLVVHSLADPPQVFSFNLAPVLFIGSLRSNRLSLALLLKLSIGLLLPLLVNSHGLKHSFMISTFTIPNSCSYTVTTRRLFTLLRTLFSTSVKNI
jgi:hypothetical protein